MITQRKSPMPGNGLRSFLTTLMGFCLVSLSIPVRAATIVWDGGGSDNTWHNNQNWAGDVAPATTSPYDVVEFSGNVQPNVTLNTDGYAETLTFNSGAAAYTFDGPGRLVVTGSSDSNHDSGLDFRNSSSATQTFNTDILLSGSNIGVRVQNGDFVFNGNIQIQGVNQLRFLGGGGRSISFNGEISGSVTSTMAFNSGGTFNLNHINTYTNATSIWSATVRVAVDSLSGVAGAFGNSTSSIAMGTTYDGNGLTATLLTSAPVTIGRGIVLASTHVNRANSKHVYTIGSDSTGISNYTGTITNGTTGGLKNASKLTVTSVAGGRVNIANIVRHADGVGDEDDVVKVGLGIVAITGQNNNWEGHTLIQAGTLLVNGTVKANTSGKNTQVSANATLGGIGSLNRDVNLAANAILAPGDIDGVSGNLGGTFTIGGDLTLNNSTILNFDLGSSTSDLVIVQGDLTLGGILNVTDLGGFSYGNYKLFEYTGDLNYTEGNVTLGSLPTGYTYSLDTTSFANSVYLTVTPEPGRFAMIILGATMWLLRRKRNQV